MSKYMAVATRRLAAFMRRHWRLGPMGKLQAQEGAQELQLYGGRREWGRAEAERAGHSSERWHRQARGRRERTSGREGGAKYPVPQIETMLPRV